MAHGRVTVSTVGVVSKIRRLTKELPEVSLALSLHAPNQEMREAIVPTAKRYPIEQLVDALDAHMNVYMQNGRSRTSARRRAMIEYVMIEGPTSTLKAAHQLGQLCEGRKVVVNLIPYNSTESAPLRCPDKSQLRAFRDVVASYKVFTTVRRTMGADIDSACGQLIQKDLHKGKQVIAPSSSPSSKPAPSDIEDTGHPLKDPNERNAKPPPTEHGSTLGDWLEPLAVATAFSAFAFLALAVARIKRQK